MDGATQTLDIAIYDMALEGQAAEVLRQAFLASAARGVRARIAYNQEAANHRRPLPPPGFVDHRFLETLPVEHRHIPGVPDLMHHKYVVRDTAIPAAAVWTGSTNWTRDSWTREENVIVRVADPAVASVYAADFEELWTSRSVRRSGHEMPAWSEGSGVRVRPYFTPGRAEKLVHEIAQRIASARRRVRVCSPVITSGPILGTLAETAGRPGLDIAGCFDATQMAEVEWQWGHSPTSSWKLAAWRTVHAALPWGEKRSTPYAPGSVHDFMHAKCTVADDTVFVGSYNLSHSGEQNAENVLEIEDPGVADRFAEYIDRVAARYRPPARPSPAAVPGADPDPGGN
ncbi:MAG: phospholipase D-like domain-containing protein [Candidatus Dormibacteraeota bacterium]|nr:phospholipase D-like domain-containing protein [Candidatus Dormibacteraeota bacterium]